AAPAAAPKRATPLPTPEGENLDEAWDVVIANAKIEEGTIRATVRQLINKKQFNHAAACIRAAMRHQHVEPWMYEALALALIAQDQPAEEIERALLSAADWSTSPTDLIYLAQYFARSTAYLDDAGRQRFLRRALRLLDQGAELAPTRPETYYLALDLARRLNEVDAIQWATVAVAKQAWPKNKLYVCQQAGQLATSTI